MGMLTIESDEAYRLAELTGESLTAAATESLRERVAGLERKQDAEERVARIPALAAEMRAEMAATGAVELTIDDLCDETTGLPT